MARFKASLFRVAMTSAPRMMVLRSRAISSMMAIVGVTYDEMTSMNPESKVPGSSSSPINNAFVLSAGRTPERDVHFRSTSIGVDVSPIPAAHTNEPVVSCVMMSAFTNLS